jgi:hypothetical protein
MKWSKRDSLLLKRNSIQAEREGERERERVVGTWHLLKSSGNRKQEKDEPKTKQKPSRVKIRIQSYKLPSISMCI